MPEKKRDRKEYQHAYYLKRREELLERRKQWSKDNPEKSRENSLRYKARHTGGKSGDILAALETIKPPEEPQK